MSSKIWKNNNLIELMYHFFIYIKKLYFSSCISEVSLSSMSHLLGLAMQQSLYNLTVISLNLFTSIFLRICLSALSAAAGAQFPLRDG